MPKKRKLITDVSAQKKDKKIELRLTSDQLSEIEKRANELTDGNKSEFLLIAALNCDLKKSDLENE